MRLRRRFMLEVGASPSRILFSARGTGSAGLGRGEIRSTSATGGGSRTALDLKVKREKNWAGKNSLWPKSTQLIKSANCPKQAVTSGSTDTGGSLGMTGSYFAALLPALLVLETPGAFSSSTRSSSEAISCWKILINNTASQKKLFFSWTFVGEQEVGLFFYFIFEKQW